jgi:hypothetical protein
MEFDKVSSYRTAERRGGYLSQFWRARGDDLGWRRWAASLFEGGGVELELAGDNGEKWECGRWGGGFLFIARGVQGIGGKDSRPLLSLKSVLIQVLVGI